jgi:hypothetical protein
MAKTGRIAKMEMAVWMCLFSFASVIARAPELAPLSRILMRFFAWQSILLHRGRRRASLQEVVFEWQRMFPSKEINSIQSIERDTAYAEVRVTCPLRGYGDVSACYRLMEYDRAMLEKIGGQLVVLRSQAEPGVDVCRVALRLQGMNMDDLVPAHERVVTRRG